MQSKHDAFVSPSSASQGTSCFSFVARLLVAAGFAAGVAASACAGETSADETSTDAGAVGTTQNDGACPHTDPGEGACTKDGLLCEYGGDFNPLCNVLYVCSGGRWANAASQANKPTCPSTPPTLGSNPVECAPTRAVVPEGQACTKTGDAASDTCSYDGSICTCGAFCPSYPVREPDCDADAGITQNCCDRTKIAWHCFDGPAYCTVPRPRVGSACTIEGESCALSNPSECGQPRLTCTNGIWMLPDVACPNGG